MNRRTKVSGVVLAAGGSQRLGTPKQILPYANTTILGATLDVARSCSLDQIVVTLGGAAESIMQTVPLDGVETVINEDFTSGSSSSLQIALRQVHPHASGIVLMLGDQPGVARATVEKLITKGQSQGITVCRYADGIGHPFWLSRNVFSEMERLRGDKGIWNLIHETKAPCRVPVHELTVDATIPLDVDTWDDYARLLSSLDRHPAPTTGSGQRRNGTPRAGI